CSARRSHAHDAGGPRPWHAVRSGLRPGPPGRGRRRDHQPADRLELSAAPAQSLYRGRRDAGPARPAPCANRPERNNPPLAISHEPPTIEAARDSRTGFLGFRSLMAKDLGLTADDILVITEGGPADRRGYRIVRDRLGDKEQGREDSFLWAPFKVAIHTRNGQW